MSRNKKNLILVTAIFGLLLLTPLMAFAQDTPVQGGHTVVGGDTSGQDTATYSMVILFVVIIVIAISAIALWRRSKNKRRQTATPLTIAPSGTGRFCANCGAQLKPNKNFCTSCGTKND